MTSLHGFLLFLGDVLGFRSVQRRAMLRTICDDIATVEELITAFLLDVITDHVNEFQLGLLDALQIEFDFAVALVALQQLSPVCRPANRLHVIRPVRLVRVRWVLRRGRWRGCHLLSEGVLGPHTRDQIFKLLLRPLSQTVLLLFGCLSLQSRLAGFLNAAAGRFWWRKVVYT